MATARFQVVALVRSARVSASGQPDPGTRATGAMLGAALFALYPVLRRLPPPGDLTGGSGSHSVPVRCDDGKYSGQGGLGGVAASYHHGRGPEGEAQSRGWQRLRAVLAGGTSVADRRGYRQYQ
jgi:hypothetical protein